MIFVSTIVGKYSQEYRKVLYLDNRRFLRGDDVLRSRDQFKDVEARGPHPPHLKEKELKDGRMVAELHKRALTSPTEKQRKKAKTDAGKLEKSTGKKGIEELARLPYYTDMDVPVELMHTIQVRNPTRVICM